jgi:hypothetical protein
LATAPRRANEGQPYQFLVTVEEAGTATQHRVTLRESDDGRPSGGRSIQTWQVGENLPGRQALVRASFHHLLACEPEASILRAFGLTLIGRQARGARARTPSSCARRIRPALVWA